MVVIDAEKHKLDYKASEIENDIAGLKQQYQRKVDPTTGKIVTGGAGTLLSRAKGQASVEKRQGSYKVNMPDSDDYDPTRPIGAKLWKKADDLYYPDKTDYNKDTGDLTIRTSDGKKITYNVRDKEQFDKYNPVKRVDPKTGKVTYTDRDGEIEYRVKTRTQKSTKMAETDDAMTLVSPERHPMELVYADYANSMKSLGNQARVEMKTTGKIAYSADMKRKYDAEVRSLMEKLDTAELNATRERAALRLANAEIQDKVSKDPDMKGSDRKKISQQALSKARSDVASVARRDRAIEITDAEWEAIQAGAISETKLKRILNNTDIDKLRERATPKTTSTLSNAQVNRIKAMAASNYTLAEIAKKMGVSPATVSKYVKGVK
jgi:DNA-binding CsgD family transcriptional regulator